MSPLLLFSKFVNPHLTNLSSYANFPSPLIILVALLCNIQSLQDSRCFIICLLRHCAILGFDCIIFSTCLLHVRHYLYRQGFHGFIICLFRRCSVLGFRGFLFCLLRHYLISSRLPSFIICLLLHCFVLGFKYLLLYLVRQHTISSRFPLFHNKYLFVTSLLCSRLQLSLLRITSLYCIFKASIASLSICYVALLGFCLLRYCSLF